MGLGFEFLTLAIRISVKSRLRCQVVCGLKGDLESAHPVVDELRGDGLAGLSLGLNFVEPGRGGFSRDVVLDLVHVLLGEPAEGFPGEIDTDNHVVDVGQCFVVGLLPRTQERLLEFRLPF